MLKAPVRSPRHRALNRFGRSLVSAAALVLTFACSVQQPRIETTDATTLAPPAIPDPPSVAARPPMPAPASLSAAPDVWERFSRERHWQHCVVTPSVDRWIKLYAGKPQRFADTLAPVAPLMDYVLTRAQSLGLPAETMLIPIIESYYRPDARGPGGALGMWQLMPDTGRRFGLTGSRSGDDRLDVRRSTDAALHLLKLNAEAFSNNPKLMFAAYNAGAYRLRKALAGRDVTELRTLDGLGLPRTTREYINKVKALGCLIGEPERFALTLPELPQEARLIEFSAPFPVDPQALSLKTGVPADDLKRWNHHAFARNATEASAPLLMPTSASAAAARAISEGALTAVQPKAAVPTIPVAAGESRVHRVASGDSLWTISKRYRVRLADLMRWNDLSKSSVLRIGQTLKLQGNS